MRLRSIAGALGLALFVAGCGEEELYNNLTAKDANEMTALLRRQGLTVVRESVEGGSYRILVQPQDFAVAVELLSKAGYPHEPFRNLAEVFPGDGLVVSPFEQRARLTFAMNQELGHTIGGIDGVVSARVHVVIPETDLRSLTPPRATASVVVHHRPSVDTADLGAKIRLIVANAVPELNFRDVSIALFQAEELAMPAPAASATAEGEQGAGQNEDATGMIRMIAPILLWITAAGVGIVALLMIMRRIRPS